MDPGKSPPFPHAGLNEAALRRTLSRAGCQQQCERDEEIGWGHKENDPVEALAVCQRTDFDLALLDYEMPVMAGSQLAQEIKYLVPDVPVVLFSSRADLPAAELE